VGFLAAVLAKASENCVVFTSSFFTEASLDGLRFCDTIVLADNLLDESEIDPFMGDTFDIDNSPIVSIM
jgi:hypothetical protein